jgi:N-carbamoylputrescine amidase
MTRLAITQMPCGWNIEDNLNQAEMLVREAAGNGAQIILLQELFATVYFCPEQNKDHFAHAHAVDDHPFLPRFRALAKELGVVLPVSFFEKSHNAYFNSMMMVDADGTDMGLYRKTHLPQGPGYEEKFYFNPGDLGFRVWDTTYGRIGVAICWDQWFPEAARIMALKGADILLYPTAIGSEPNDPSLDSSGHWQRTMQGHAAANMITLAASNRIGKETIGAIDMTFYGQSFIADHTGALVAECHDGMNQIATADIDIAAMKAERASWGLFRDRRPEHYQDILSLS